jgi:hypothetical protein
MKLHHRLLFVSALALFALPSFARSQAGEAPASATMLRLRDGSIAWGTILAHDPDGIQFERLENGGRVRLAWSFLHPEEERDMRQRWGYVDLSNDEVMIDADRIQTIEGAEIIGLIIDRSGDNFLVKTSSATIPLPKTRVAGAPTTVQVPAIEVFTRPELYAQKLANSDTTSADGEYQLAQWCERILDYAHAVEHYKRAKEIDAKFRTEDVRQALERAVDKAARQDQIDYLNDIDGLVGRRKFDDALARIDAFAQKFPDSPLLPQAKKVHDRVIKARDAYMTDRTATLWILRSGQVARTASVKMMYEEALNYCGGQMGKDVLDGVTKEMLKLSKESTPDAVKKLWLQRKKQRWNRASYGLGTWLLGKDAALKGNDEKAETPKVAVNEKDKERLELEKKLQRFLQNQELARKAKSNADQTDDREKAWKEMSPDARAGWMLAYYCENSGDFEVNPKPTFSACPECGGTGTLVMALAGGNVSRSAIGKASTDTKMECPTCHGLGVTRKISYR